MKTTVKDVEVWADWMGLQAPSLVGALKISQAKVKEIFSFEYDETWLTSQPALSLDPRLQLFRGPQYNQTEKPNFGLFLDSAPDRWGRLLQRRAAALRARRAGMPPPRLLESDYLLGVFDGHRLGGLRFRTETNGPFQNDDHDFSAPPMTSLRELEAASRALEIEDAEEIPDEDRWLQMLIAPGGSLGGARPKASVRDEAGNLWIAKFPSANDAHDSGAWEFVVHELASLAGIDVPRAILKQFNHHHHTFLVERFDRQGARRKHFASAMTMLDGTSYLELAEFLTMQGAKTGADLEQLWRRIVFSICISNTDDHLRNHGFLLDQAAWKLSPAYDMNPNADGDGLKLNISEDENTQDIDLALSVASFFRLAPQKAGRISKEIVGITKNWRASADKLKIPRAEQNRMARAFRVAELS